MAKAVHSKPRTWQEWEADNRTPGGRALGELADRGFNINWILTGEGEMHIRPEHAAAHADMVADVLEGDSDAGRRREAAIQEVGHRLRTISDRITNILGAAGVELSADQRAALEGEVHEIVRDSKPDPKIVPPLSNVVDEPLLARIVQRLEELIEEADEEWTPAARARLIARAYREEKEDEALDDKERQAIGRIRATQSEEPHHG